jgi:hypothetical protein
MNVKERAVTMPHAVFTKIFDNYDVRVIKLTDNDFELRIMFRNTPVSFSIADSPIADEAIDKANHFLDMYDLARQYNFHVTSQGLRHDNSYMLSYEQMFQLAVKEFALILETDFKNA